MSEYWQQPITDLSQANDHLYQLIEAAQGLPSSSQRRRRASRVLLRGLGNPQHRVTAIHITGSKGKGSTGLLLDYWLQKAGFKTGLFTSPHLQHWQERICCDGVTINNDQFIGQLERLRPLVVTYYQQTGHWPPYFAVIFAMAMDYFARQHVAVALIEVGIGGRWDATNWLRPKIACITSIEYEHVKQLGPRLTDIARHKAGIIKPGCSTVIGLLPEEAGGVIAEQARRHGSVLIHSEQDNNLLWQALKITKPPLWPDHLLVNARLALSVLHLWPLTSWQRQEIIKSGWPLLPGRCQWVVGSPNWFIDSAHTTRSMQGFVQALQQRLLGQDRGKLTVILSLSADKGPQILAPLAQLPIEQLILTQAEPSRSLAVEELQQMLPLALQQIPCHLRPNPQQAFTQGQNITADDGVIACTGSVFLAGAASGWLKLPVDTGPH